MQRRIVKSKGKTYIVNCVGWEDGVGAGCPSGMAALADQYGNWYYVMLAGSSGSVQLWNTDPNLWNEVSGSWNISGDGDNGLYFYIQNVTNKTQDMYQNSFPFQLVIGNDNKIYQVSINSGSTATVAVTQTPSIYSDSKPFMFLQSITDGCFYTVCALNVAGTITLQINANSQIQGSLVTSLN